MPIGRGLERADFAIVADPAFVAVVNTAKQVTTTAESEHHQYSLINIHSSMPAPYHQNRLAKRKKNRYFKPP